MYHFYHSLMTLLQELGLENTTSKLIEPANIAVYLGTEINLVNRKILVTNTG